MRFLVFTSVLLVACSGGDVSLKDQDVKRPPRIDAAVVDVPVAPADVGQDNPDVPRSPMGWGRDARLDSVVPDVPQPDSDAGVIVYGDADGGVVCPGLLCSSADDDDNTTWDAGAGQPDDWAVVDGTYAVLTSKVSSEYLTGSPDWTDVSVRVRVKIIEFGAPLAAYRVGVMARYQRGPHRYYAVLLRGDQRVELRRENQQLGDSIELPVTVGDWHVLELKVSGPPQAVQVSALLDGNVIATATDEQGLASGQVGLVTFGSGTQALFDDVLVGAED